MIKSFSKKQTVLAFACALALSTLSGVAAAQSTAAVDSSYLFDNEGAVLTTASGLCVHTSSGPAPKANAQCDPAFVPAPMAKLVPPPMPQAAIEAPAPRAAPVVAQVPALIIVAAVKPAPVLLKVTVDADTLFDFDKSVLRPVGRDALDAFAGKIKDINPDVISAIGHTDRLGAQSYNQSLSERRAEAVKAYLMSTGIAADRIHAEGKGESQPVTKAGDCSTGKNAKLIACLQPDRRVDIEVVGSRSM